MFLATTGRVAGGRFRRVVCMVALAGVAMASARNAVWLKQTFPQTLGRVPPMADSMRASFAYKENNDMTDEIKNALAHLDLDKTGRVSTSELVAAAKALEEVRRRLGPIGMRLCGEGG